MGLNWIDDTTMRVLRTALDGSAAKQQAISRNLANVDTPGYRATTVNFEDAVRSAMNQSKHLPMQVTNAAHYTGMNAGKAAIRGSERPNGSDRVDGNNVDVDVEMSEMSEVGIEYQALTQAASKKLALLKAIAQAR